MILISRLLQDFTANTETDKGPEARGHGKALQMKRAKDLMKEMGFREEASEGAKEAFLKNLIKAAYGVEVETPTEKRTKNSKTWIEQRRKNSTISTKVEGEQLSFDFTTVEKPKKAL